jgi:hypothetical protein
LKRKIHLLITTNIGKSIHLFKLLSYYDQRGPSDPCTFDITSIQFFLLRSPQQTLRFGTVLDAFELVVEKELNRCYIKSAGITWTSLIVVGQQLKKMN